MAGKDFGRKDFGARHLLYRTCLRRDMIPREGLNQGVTMQALKRIARHARLTSYNYRDLENPPFLILFINSICNMKCEHCFYWRQLNQPND